MIVRDKVRVEKKLVGFGDWLNFERKSNKVKDDSKVSNMCTE